MSATPTQRLLAVVLDDQPLDDALVRDLALSSDAHGELVRLATVLARLPGKGARAAELRLDHLLDDVALVAASESRTPPVGADASHRPDVAHGEPHARGSIRGTRRAVLAGVALAAAAIAVVIVWSSRGPDSASSPPTSAAWSPEPPAPAACPPEVPAEVHPRLMNPAPQPGPPSVVAPALIAVQIRATPATATLSIDGVTVAGNPFVGWRKPDDARHRIDVSAPGYISKTVTVAFNANAMVDLSLQRAQLVAVGPSPPRAPVWDKIARLPAPAMPAPTAKRDVPPAQSIQGVVGRVMIATNAQNGEVLIDDVRVARTPLEQPLVIAARLHTLTVMAEGYAPETRAVDVPAAGTVRIELSLRPAVRASAVDASGGVRPARPIDRANPYQAQAP